MQQEDKNLLKAAANALGMKWIDDRNSGLIIQRAEGGGVYNYNWDPMRDDGDAFRLAAAMHMDFRWDANDGELRASCTAQGHLGHSLPGEEVEHFEKYSAEEIGTTAPYRRAATRLAAKIGKAMP